jgi:hypothetical protein
MVEIDHPPLQGLAKLANPASSRNEVAGKRMAGEMINQQRALVLVHDPPSRDKKLERLDDADVGRPL